MSEQYSYPFMVPSMGSGCNNSSVRLNRSLHSSATQSLFVFIGTHVKLFYVWKYILSSLQSNVIVRF